MPQKKPTADIPDFELDSLARVLLPAIQKLFEKEETQKEFEEWLKERERQRKEASET